MNDPHVRSCMAGTGLAANLVGVKPRAIGRTVLDALVTRCRALTDRQRDATSPLGRWMSIHAQFLCTSSPRPPIEASWRSKELHEPALQPGTATEEADAVGGCAAWSA